MDIVFDGPPGPVAGRFVEVESPPGTSIKFGEWLQRPDGYWVLRFDQARAGAEMGDGLERAAELCDRASGRHFDAIKSAPDEAAKHKHGAKTALAMELAAQIRALIPEVAGGAVAFVERSGLERRNLAHRPDTQPGEVAVPREATEEMIRAAQRIWDQGGSYQLYRAWQAMLAAAPQREG